MEAMNNHNVDPYYSQPIVNHEGPSDNYPDLQSGYIKSVTGNNAPCVIGKCHNPSIRGGFPEQKGQFLT